MRLGSASYQGLTDHEIKEIVSQCSFDKFTANTISKEEFLRQIEMVGINGWAVDNEEHEEGIRCIAAPVYDYRDKIIAAVSITGTNTVIVPEKDSETGAIVKDIAFKISKRMGYKKN